jgi:acyl-CoA dehydrogenase
MDYLNLPLFEDHHRHLAGAVQRLCDERLLPLSGTEMEDAQSAAVEYVALLGQEGLFDPALGRALEGEAPKPDLRGLCLARSRLGQTSGLADAAYGAQVQGMYPIALAGNEDHRAIFLPGMAAGQSIVSLGLLDGETPLTVAQGPGGYRLQGEKAVVPFGPIADTFVVLARHKNDSVARYSLFAVSAREVEVQAEDFLSTLPAGRVRFEVEVDEEARIGGDGQGLVIAQATLDILRLPVAAGCIGIASQALTRGTLELLRRGVGGRPVRDQQGSQWRLADALCHVEAARSVVHQAAWARDTSSSREVRATTMARMLAQDAAEEACSTVADLIGIRGLAKNHPWQRLLAEVRALRLESEFLENPRTVVAQALLASLEGEGTR